MKGLWRATRALLIAELRIQVREYMTWIWLLAGALCVGGGLAWLAGNLDTPLIPELNLDAEDEETELPELTWSVQGEVPTWLESTLVPLSNDATVALRIEQGTPLVLHIDGEHSKLLDQAEKALHKAKRIERKQRLETLDVAAASSQLEVEVLEQEEENPEIKAGLALGPIAAMLMYLTVASMLVESLPRSRDTGYLSTLLTLDVPRSAMLLAWSMASVAWGLLAVVALAIGWNVGASFGTNEVARAGWSLLALPAVAMLSATSTLRLVVTARDLRAASARLGIAPLIGMGFFLLAAQTENLWGELAGSLIPIGGLALAISKPTAINMLGATLASLVMSWALFNWTSRVLDAADEGDSQASPVVRRRARGDWLPEVLLLAAIGLTGSAAWGGTLTEKLGQPALGIAILMVFFYGLPAVLAPWVWGQRIKPLLSLRRPANRSLLLAPLVAALSLPLSGSLVYATRWLLGGRVDDGEAVGEVLLQMSQSPGGILAMSVGPGICEELLFRGALLGLLRRRFSTWTAVGIQAALFAVVHAHPIRLPPTFLLGLMTGAMVVKTRSLWPAVLLHTAHNAISFVVASGGAEPALDAPGIGIAVLSALIGAAAFVGVLRSNKA